MDVKITVVRKAEYLDLKEKYENPISHACDLRVGMVFVSHDGEKPENFCDSAWGSVKEFVLELANGGGNFYDGWMKNPNSAMISCNDGFRPVSFLLETITIDEEVKEFDEEIVAINENVGENPISEEEQKRLEEEFIRQKEEEVKQALKHERFLEFKKAYNRAGLNVLIFFGILQVVCSFFMIIGSLLSAILEPEFNISVESIAGILNGNGGGEYAWLSGLFYVIGYVITIILTIIFNKKLIYEKDKPVEKNIRRLSFNEIIIMLGVSFGLWGIGVLIGNLPEFVGFGLEDTSIETIFGGDYLLYACMAIFGAPLIEELVCRKFFIDKTAKYGETIAVMVSALFFGLMHANSGQFFLAFNLGLIMGVIYVKTRNILYTMLIHFVINFWGTVTIFTDMIFANNEELALLCNDIWNYATYALMLIGIATLIVFVFVKKKELFIPKANNEFAGKMVFKSIGIKLFFIITLVLTGIQDLMRVVAYLSYDGYMDRYMVFGSYMLFGSLLQLFVELVFAFTIVFIRKYIKKTMVPKITVE